MNEINNLSKSDSYLENLDMDKLVKSVQSSLACTNKIALAVAKLISAKIFLEMAKFFSLVVRKLGNGEMG